MMWDVFLFKVIFQFNKFFDPLTKKTPVKYSALMFLNIRGGFVSCGISMSFFSLRHHLECLAMVQEGAYGSFVGLICID